jgi:hypothetical protein
LQKSPYQKERLKLYFLTMLTSAAEKRKKILMKKISEIQSVLKTNELLTINEIFDVKGGRSFRDDKRRQRPGGGTSTTSPIKVNNNLKPKYSSYIRNNHCSAEL